MFINIKCKGKHNISIWQYPQGVKLVSFAVKIVRFVGFWSF